MMRLGVRDVRAAFNGVALLALVGCAGSEVGSGDGATCVDKVSTTRLVSAGAAGGPGGAGTAATEWWLIGGLFLVIALVFFVVATPKRKKSSDDLDLIAVARNVEVPAGDLRPGDRVPSGGMVWVVKSLTWLTPEDVLITYENSRTHRTAGSVTMTKLPARTLS